MNYIYSIPFQIAKFSGYFEIANALVNMLCYLILCLVLFVFEVSHCGVLPHSKKASAAFLFANLHKKS